MIPTTVWMDFTGVYADGRCADEKRRAGRKGREIYCSCRDISGTNCYCDEDAARELCARMSGYPAEGLHFIDSGNYHYVSRLWLSFIEEPCQLLVFDNHTDMQPPAFGGLLSCGGWIADAAGSLSQLERVLLAGPDEEAFEAAEPESRAKARLLSREKLSEARREGRLPGLFREWCSQHLTGHPLYLSIDKDVLSPDFARTGWSQGDLRLTELLAMLEILEEQMADKRLRLLGVDICGACDPDDAEGMRINEEADRLLGDWAERAWHRPDEE